MVFVETSFPRGGSKKAKTDQVFQDTTEVFGAVVAKPKKKTKGKEKSRSDKDDATAEEDIIPVFRSTNVRTNELLIMGCVRDIKSTHLTIQLPCQQIGKVPANAISKAYTRLLTQMVVDGAISPDFKSLDQLFKIGQLVTVKVMDASDHIIELSMNPQDINFELIHSKIVTGYVLTCSIDEIEDHGYIIDTGVKNLRAFLPKENAARDDYIEGELISCCVETIDTSKSASTAKLKSIDRIKHKDDETVPILSMLLPQSHVQFKITKIMKGIIVGSICEGAFQGAVLNYHLQKPSMSPNEYSVGLEVDAKIICIMPLSKIVYLTLNLRKIVKIGAPGLLPLGKVVKNAEVIRQNDTIVEVKLKNSFKGVIKRHLGNDATMNPGQKIKVKLLDYNMFDRVYLCSDDERLFHEHEFTLDKLKVCDKVDFVVSRINEAGIIGFIGIYGNLKTFMQTMDVSMQNVKRSDIIPVKITAIMPDGKIEVTNREEYLNPKKKAKFLTSYEDAVEGEIFKGTVVKVFAKFYLIRFFNGVMGTITKNVMTEKRLSEGQVTNFKISQVRIDEDGEKHKMYLALPESIEQDEHLGEIFDAVVKSHIPTGVNIMLSDKTKGFISGLAFAASPTISQQICNSLKDGDKIKCICIDTGFYSFRCLDYFKKNPIKSLQELQPGDVIRSYVKNIIGKKVELYAPVKNFTQHITLPLGAFVDDRSLIDDVKLSPEQIIMLKVIKVNANSIKCTPQLSQVWNYDFPSATEHFVQYLKEHDKLRKSMSKKKNPIVTYEIGQVVKGEVSTVDPITKDLTLKFENNVKGRIRSSLYAGEVIEGASLSGTIIWIDYINKTLELQSKYECGDIEINKEALVVHKAKLAFETEHFSVAILKTTNVPVFIPKHVHYNDLFSISTSFTVHKNAKLFVLRKFQNVTIGVFAEFYNIGDAMKTVEKDRNSRKRKAQEHDFGGGVDMDLMEMLRMLKKQKDDEALIMEYTVEPIEKAVPEEDATMDSE